MNKLTLKFELDLDFVLVAITCQLKDYRICYLINKALQADFVRIDELQLNFIAENTSSSFSRYAYLPKNSETEFYLLANRGTGALLIPEMAGVDYFLLIKNFIDEEDLNHWISTIKKIPEVLATVEVEPKKLKSKENLLF